MNATQGRARRRVWHFIPPAALGFAALMLAASNPAQPESDPAEAEPRTVRVVEALAQPITPRAIGFGAVEPSRTWSIAPDVSGRIVFISPNFTEGAFVSEGEIVLRIEDADYQLVAAQSRADILAVDAQIDELRLQEENLRATLALEQQRLAVSERELARQRALVERGAGTAAAADAAEQSTLGLRAGVLELENQIRLIPAQIAALESSRAVSSARLEAAELDIARTEIKAPFDGRVAAADVEISQFVSVGAVLGAVDGVAQVEVTALFPAATLRNLGRLLSVDAGSDAAAGDQRRIDHLGEDFGLSARVVLEVGSGALFDAAPASWSADVLRISEEIDAQTRAVGVIVAVQDPYGQARPGERPALIKGAFMRVELFAPPVDGFVLAPRSALSTSESGARELLVVDAENRLARRAVTILSIIGDIAVIGDGVAPGELIIVTDLTPAIEGELLRPVRDDAAAARLTAAATLDAAQ